MAVADVVAVLHRNDRDDLARLLELAHRDVRESHMAYLAFALEIGERADLVLEWHLGIRRVKLVNVDTLELEPLETPFQVLAQFHRPAILVPVRGLRPHEAALRADDEIPGIRMHRLRDRDLAVMRSIALRGVEEIGAELVRAAQHAMRVRLVLRRTPDIGVLDHAHGAVADAIDAELTDFHLPVP